MNLKNNYPRKTTTLEMRVQWLSGRVLDSRPRGRGFKPHQRHCFVSLSNNINPSLVLVKLRKTRPFITERLLMGRKESNQTNQTLGREWKIRACHAIAYGFLCLWFRKFSHFVIFTFHIIKVYQNPTRTCLLHEK